MYIAPDLELIFVLLKPAGSSTAMMLPDRYFQLITITDFFTICSLFLIEFLGMKWKTHNVALHKVYNKLATVTNIRMFYRSATKTL